MEEPMSADGDTVRAGGVLGHRWIDNADGTVTHDAGCEWCAALARLEAAEAQIAELLAAETELAEATIKQANRAEAQRDALAEAQAKALAAIDLEIAKLSGWYEDCKAEGSLSEATAYGHKIDGLTFARAALAEAGLE